MTAPQTLTDAVIASLATATRAPEGVAAPAAILWTDADGQWQGLLPALKAALPQLCALGAYAPAERTGPVIWLKCIVERTLPEVSPPADVIPILYLPRVGRQELRAGGDCPRALQPLIELQFRGAVWHQRNGRDWTVDAFLTSDDALGLDVAQDARTREAMLRALPLLAAEPVDGLRGRRLDADDFDKLAIGDPVRDLLGWLSGAEAFQARCDGARWATFRDVCVREFHFDPDADGTPAAADALLHGSGRWNEVWRRFCEAPKLYPGVATALREARPKDLLVDRSRRPGCNEGDEDRLRTALEALCGLPHGEACDRVVALEKEHKDRRDWVWAQLGQSPLAQALEPLARLAALARTPLGGTSPQSIAADYAANGWRCDRAALDALGLSQGAGGSLIARVVRALYAPWLDATARHFQALITAAGLDARALSQGVAADRETCIVFADGLRFDIAGRLQEVLEGRGLRVQMGHRFAALPTVTATAKPLASPAHTACAGGETADDFTPLLTASQQPVNAPRLRDQLARQGVEVLDADDIRFAGNAENGGWTEIGRLDELGHSLGALLVRQIESEVDAIVERVAGLLGAGWSRIRVVTDHGWLLLPGGLPKVELPPYLVATKWARCAAVRGASSPEVPTYPWHWNSHLSIASPPGIGAFFAGTEYAHGGVSPQECVVPDLVVERGEEAVRAKIASVVWRGMRCRVSVDTNATGIRVDLRLNRKQATSSIAAAAKVVDRKGEASLAVADDRHEGAAATVVVLDAAGQVLDHQPTTVGENQ